MAQKQAYAVSQGNRRVQRARNMDQIAQLKKEGRRDEADKQTEPTIGANTALAAIARTTKRQEQQQTTRHCYY